MYFWQQRGNGVERIGGPRALRDHQHVVDAEAREFMEPRAEAVKADRDVNAGTDGLLDARVVAADAVTVVAQHAELVLQVDAVREVRPVEQVAGIAVARDHAER